MADLRRPSVRAALTLAVVVLGLFQVQSLLEILVSQSRLRERVARSVQEPLRASRPRIDALLEPGGPAGWDAALQVALASTPAAEAELFTRQGQRLAARPAPAPVDHWLGPADLEALRGASVVTVGPVAGRAGRLLTYTAARSAGQDVLLRLSTPAADLVEDFRERRRLLIGHGVAIVLLVLVGALAIFPARQEPAGPAPSAIDAYVEAMERLRDHGEALSQRHEALEEAMRDKEALARAGELTAGMVHEVRNGLGTIVGYARLVEGGPASPAAVDAAHRIREECETLETVVRRFMDFVRRETLHLAPFDLARMLSRVASRESRGRAGGQVVMRAAEGHTVVGDEELLERAFENLVRNAREAAGPGGHVWIDVSGDEPSLTVTVSDDGPGISPDDRARLRPFFTTKAGGLGMGLPIALKIVRLHGGELTLGDRFPRGASVQVRLPRSGPKTDQAVTQGSEQPPTSGAHGMPT